MCNVNVIDLMLYRLIFTALMLVVLAFQVVESANASATTPIVRDEVTTRLVNGNMRDSGYRNAGIHLKIKKDWYTYWRSPGDGGLAPSIDWSGSTNVAEIAFLYPAPERIKKVFEGFDPIETYGYKDEVVFPLLIKPENPNRTIKLALKFNYGVCDELCIFLNDSLTKRIPYNHKDATTNKLINEYLQKTPAYANPQKLKITGITHQPNHVIEVLARSKQPFDKTDVFVESSQNFRFPEPQISIGADKKTAILRIPYETLLADASLENEPAMFTLTNNGYGTELQTIIPTVGNEALLTENANPIKHYLYILLAAFLGGLILNIMPCVLPVLSIKLLGVLNHGGDSALRIRLSFLASAAGIILSFLLFSAIVIALQSAGHAVGWGFHFQEPLFLIALIILINLFACNLWGLYEINLPHWLGGKLHSSMSSHDDQSMMGHFMTGVFAAILATPCSAPYLGTAMSFALAGSATDIMMVFMVMGLGLAFPYLLFVIKPSLVATLPKPGSWMITMKYIMGLLLALASVWLLWVLTSQIGLISSVIVAFLSLSSVGLLWSYKKRIFPKSLPVLLLIIIMGLAATFIFPTHYTYTSSIDAHADMWVPFNEQDIISYVEQGNVVFVDVTADWCLTCKFNKINVMNNSPVIDRLQAPDVIPMKADYTSPSKAITAFLRKHNRYGIPFNIVYGPAAPQGIPLSELLTASEVESALDSAKNSP